MTPPARPSSALRATALLEVRESVAYWLRRARTTGQHDLADAVVDSLASVAAVASKGVLAGIYSAGIASGLVAAYLRLGRSPPDGPLHCRCPACGADITTLGDPP